MNSSQEASRPTDNVVLGLIRAVLAWLEKMPHDALALIARFGMAAIFWRAGMDKMTDWSISAETFQQFTEKFRIPLLPPELATELATYVEHVSPVLLAVGLASRIASASLIFVTLIIFIFVHAGEWPDFLIWASAMIYVLTKGPGRISLDHLVRRYFLPERGGAA